MAGPETLSPEELAANRTDIGEEIVRNALASDAYYLERLPDWSKISVPLLSCANWGGAGIAFAG
ncbi:MAG TPA: hypothetical protein VMW83_10740 [Spirochaetia bacterium]|nr:hypothetical protein [Spirochaetia bacterium]